MNPQAAKWDPQVGSEATSMIDRSGLPTEQGMQVLEEARRVLSRCVSPHDWDRKDTSAELVVGEVQSGKTMSFTALTALAHDNRIPLVVVLAGTKTNLMEQTLDRLRRDLRMDGDGGIPTWRPLNLRKERSPNDVAPLISSMRHSDGTKHTTTVAVVLKNSTNLRHAKNFVSSLTQQCGAFPALIIDDEGDQAGLNLLSRKHEESPTYRSIRELRDSLPLHTYVIYTATPQAPLLISLTDTVSPRTVTVLQHGPGYVGGEELFINRENRFAHAIYDNDDALDPSQTAPPKSLQTALATFLIALAVTQKRDTPKPLSMLIHPSSETDLHHVYEGWVNSLIYDRIKPALLSDDKALIAQLRDTLFRVAYEELSATGGTTVGDRVLSLDEILTLLLQYLASIRVISINSKNGAEIESRDWYGRPGWIVIGGAKLDRGFTVENLAVTYMPRSPGIKNADTIQQRGRFFGYRRSYLDVLRAWINPDTIEVYRNYVEHEKTMRHTLSKFDECGKSLKTWRRSFLLDESMHPTRSQVIALDLESMRIRSGWLLRQAHLYTPHVGPDQSHVQRLRSLMEEASVDQRDRRKDAARRNRYIEVDWSTVAPILADWNALPKERGRIEALLMSIDSTQPHPKVDLVFMDGLMTRTRDLPDSRRGSASVAFGSQLAIEALSVTRLQQGPGHSGADAGYPGDEAFRSRDNITIQIHRVQPMIHGKPSREPVFALALHSPEDRGRYIQQT